MGKEESPGNQHFFLLQSGFVHFLKQILSFCLQMFSVLTCKILSYGTEFRTGISYVSFLFQLTDEAQQCTANKDRLEDFIKQHSKDLQHVKHSIQKSELDVKV